jgi:peptide deformylase
VRREIVLLGDEILRRKARPVKAVDAGTRRLIDDLVQTMREADGLGLAAPQIGAAKRVFVCRDGDDVLVLVNPQFKRLSGRDVGVEGCLSMPGLQGNVPRAKHVVITGLDRSGRTVTYEAEGLLARCMQHEYDHLNGVMFIDHTKDLWWLERVAADESEPQGEVEEVDETEAGGGPKILVRRVPCTLPEVMDYYAEMRGELAAVQEAEAQEAAAEASAA